MIGGYAAREPVSDLEDAQGCGKSWPSSPRVLTPASLIHTANAELDDTVPDTVIDNPILNSPFAEPARHFRFDEEGITSEIVDERRTSTYFVPIPKARKRGANPVLPGDWTEDRIQANADVDRIRGRVALWRQGGYAGVTFRD